MSPNQGGIETFMMNVFLKLEGRGFHFTFLNIYKHGIAYSKSILNYGGTVKTVLIPNNIRGHLIRTHKMMIFFSKCRIHYDIVHVNAMSINAIFWLKIAAKFGVQKLIIQSHVSKRTYSSNIIKFMSFLLSLGNRHYLHQNDNIVQLAVDDSSGDWMFHDKNYHVIPNGIDTKKFKFSLNKRLFFRRKLKLNNKDKIIITVARLSYQKNYIRIIYIFNKVYKIDPSCRLVIVGDGPQKKILMNLVHKLHLNSVVLFLGFISNVSDILNIADMMLMPSRYEGLPFSLIEGQACGVPALVSLNVVPLEANITGTLKYISLSNTNNFWAKKVYEMLKKSPNVKKKLKMNYKVSHSKYNINNAINIIRTVYLN